MSFLFPKRETTTDSERDSANRQEFDSLAESIKFAYSQAHSQPAATLASLNEVRSRIKSARTLDRRQRDILLAYLHDAIGSAKLDAGKIGEGLAFLEKAAKTYQTLPDKTPLVNNLLNQARAWMMDNDLKKAVTGLERSLEVAKAGRLSQTEADVLYKLGVLYSLTGQTAKASEIFGRGLLLSQQIGSLGTSASFLTQFGQLNLQNNELEKAEDNFERSRTLFEEAGDQENLMITYGQLDQLYRRKGDQERALEYATRGLELARQQANRREEAVFLQDLARIYFAREDFPQATQLAQESLEVSRQVSEQEAVMRSLQLLAEIATEQKDFGAAHAWIDEGYNLARQQGDRRELALFLNQIADLKLAEGDPPGAITRFEELASLFKDLNDPPTLATLYVRMGDTYLEALNDPTGATLMVERSFDLSTASEGEASMFAFTSAMRLIQLLAAREFYNEGLAVAGKCLEQAKTRLSLLTKTKNRKNKAGVEQQGRWLLFVQVLVILVATLQDLKTGTPNYQPKVTEILDQLKTRFGDTFTLETWTGEMYERLK